MTMPYRIATGFEFQPLPDGNVRIEFCGDGGQIINIQVVADDVFARIPLAAFSTLAATDQGAEVAETLIRIVRAAEEAGDGSRE